EDMTVPDKAISIPLFSISPAFTNLDEYPVVVEMATGLLWSLELVLYADRSRRILLSRKRTSRPPSTLTVLSGKRFSLFFVGLVPYRGTDPNGVGLLSTSRRLLAGAELPTSA